MARILGRKALITVKLKLFGTLPRHVPDYRPESGIDVEMVDGSTYRDMMETLHLPEEEARLIIVNGKSKRPTDPVSEGEDIFFFLPLGGG